MDISEFSLRSNVNPMDQLWKDLKTAVAGRHPSKLRDLEQLAKECSRIPEERCKEVIHGYR